MKKFIKLVERYLMRTIVITLVVLVVVQSLMTYDNWRFYLSLGERLEGQVIKFPVNTADKGEEDNLKEVKSPYALLTISYDKYDALPKANILINDKVLANLTDNDVDVLVAAGDVLEIDATAYNFPIEFIVSGVSDNLFFPEKGEIYISNQSLVMIGKIIVK
ncbi:MAG: hypothetical protein GX333_10020 [Syntrophomonadaceae bacterium]|nr:hypothetical protein [Syntrophomonadaceae bacterium]